MAAYKTDVAVIGGGLAGSLTAAMLGRAGIDCVLVDPHTVYPDDFRCEKFDGPQVAILRKTGLADAVLRAATFDRVCWVGRMGRVVDKRPSDQQGFFYTSLVNTIRGEIPATVPFIRAKAQAIAASTERQTVTLDGGDSIDARLVVMANGLSVSVRDSLSLKRDVLSPCHSVAVGFAIKPKASQPFAFPALTYYAERPADKAAYITLFPIGDGMRANLFVYRDFDDPMVRAMRHAPQETLYALMPRLRPILGDFTVDSKVQIRPIDLYVSDGHRRAGVVLVGDAFATSCPAAGTGARKALTDAERLCNHHIPRWLNTPGMDAAKIAAFYDDPVKQECDAFSADKAVSLKRMSIETSARARAYRTAKFAAQALRGALRAALHADDEITPQPAAAGEIAADAVAKPL